MARFRFSRVATAFCLVLFFLPTPFFAGQDVPATVAESDAEEYIDPFTIKVDVNEVRLDVVVVDSRGRQITDLTADDFEVYQNRQPQQVTSSVYVSNQADAAATPAVFGKSGKDAPKLPQLPATTLKKEEVRRTILFVIDNLSMSFQELHYAKMSVERFVDRQMQPGDLVSVMHTSSGNSALNMFSSDKRLIIAQADSAPPEGVFYADAGTADPNLHRVYESQLLIMSHSIRALRDMPGRKILMFLTSRPTIANPQSKDVLGAPPVNYFELYGGRFNRLADEAMRAGAVVHMLDARGLEYYEPESQRDERANEEKVSLLNPLPEQTGGIFIENSNFFFDGVDRDVNNMIAGYYLVSYAPPPSTFEIKNKDVYHNVNVRVRRQGAVVHTRDGFYGRMESETDSGATAHPLGNAITSPFLHSGISVNMTAGYTRDDKAGYLVRSWIHIDPNDVTIVETETGARIDLEAVCLTSGINGAIHDIRHVQYAFDITSENIAWIRKHGIRFSLVLPVKNPGHYAVRFAVHDMESGKVGSAYQFVEVPDLKKKGLELSNVFMITSAEDLVWMHSDATEELAKKAFFPVLRNDEARSPAFRTLAKGDNLQTLTMLYNADAKELVRSEIEMQSILYKDGMEFQLGESVSITPANVKNPANIPIFKVTPGSEMPPGAYLLQLLVTDKKNRQISDEEGAAPAPKEERGGLFARMVRSYLGTGRSNGNNRGVASQTLSFTVTE